MNNLDAQFEELIERLNKAEADNAKLRSIVNLYESMRDDYETLIKIYEGDNEKDT